MSDIFISYTRKDQGRVEPLAKALEKAGWSVWWDLDIRPSEIWSQVIEKKLKAVGCVLVFWSNKSINSPYVSAEAAFGFKKGKYVPVLIDAVEIPIIFGSVQAANLIDWHGDENDFQYRQLLDAIKDMLVCGKSTEQASQSDANAAKASERGGQRTVRTDQAVIYAPRGGYELVRIPGSEFLMGSPDSEKDRRDDEGPQHTVRIADFYMGRYPVTNEQYGRFIDKYSKTTKPKHWTNSSYSQPREPAGRVSWEDAKQYARWAGLQLPSEAQWEYACRAGKKTRFHSGEKEWRLWRAGWYIINSGQKIHPVGEKKPNAFGLYDMHGNVGEWVEDDWHENYEGAPADGGAWINEPRGPLRVVRGGNYYNHAGACRSACRGREKPDSRPDYLGFRLVLVPGQPGWRQAGT